MASGQASTRGSACSTERRESELLDTMARHGDDGGRLSVGGAAAAASAMVGEIERERQGENGCVRGSRQRRGARPGVQGRGRQAGGAVASSRSSASPLCLPGEDEAAGWHGPAQCWACQVGCGQVSGPGKIPLSLLFIVTVFYYFCICWALFKISRHFQKSPNCTWSLVGIFPAWNISVWDYLSI